MYYSEPGGQKWGNQSLHLELRGVLSEVPVKVRIEVGSTHMDHKHFEWRVVDTANRFMDMEARIDQRYEFRGRNPAASYKYFDSMVVDIYCGRTITEKNSARVIIQVGDQQIISPPFRAEKSSESHRKRRLTASRKAPLAKKRRTVAAADTDDEETSSEEEEDDDTDSDEESDVETDNKGVQCDISTEELRRMIREREDQDVEEDARSVPSDNAEEEASEAESAPSDNAEEEASDARSVPSDNAEEEASDARSVPSDEVVSPVSSPGRRSIVSSVRSRSSSFDLLGSLDGISGIPMPPSIVSAPADSKLMDMLIQNQNKLVGIVASLAHRHGNT